MLDGIGVVIDKILAGEWTVGGMVGDGVKVDIVPWPEPKSDD